jgi:hypothetical protein
MGSGAEDCEVDGEGRVKRYAFDNSRIGSGILDVAGMHDGA